MASRTVLNATSAASLLPAGSFTKTKSPANKYTVGSVGSVELQHIDIDDTCPHETLQGFQQTIQPNASLGSLAEPIDAKAGDDLKIQEMRRTLTKTMAEIETLCKNNTSLHALKIKNQEGPLYKKLIYILNEEPLTIKRGELNNIIKLILLKDIRAPKLTPQDWIELNIGGSEASKSAMLAKTSALTQPIDDVYGSFLLGNLLRFITQKQELEEQFILGISSANISLMVDDEDPSDPISDPVYFSASYGLIEEVLKNLLQAGMDVYTRNGAGESALHILATIPRDYSEILKLMIRNGVHINQQSKENGATPLHFYIQNNQIKSAELLIENGANINLRTDKEKFTPERLAFISNRGDIFTLFYKNKRFDPLHNKTHRVMLKEAKKRDLTHILKSMQNMMTPTLPRGLGWIGKWYSAFLVWFLA